MHRVSILKCIIIHIYLDVNCQFFFSFFEYLVVVFFLFLFLLLFLRFYGRRLRFIPKNAKNELGQYPAISFYTVTESKTWILIDRFRAVSNYLMHGIR